MGQKRQEHKAQWVTSHVAKTKRQAQWVRSHAARTLGPVGQGPCVENIRHSVSEAMWQKTPGATGQKPCGKNNRRSGSEAMWQEHQAQWVRPRGKNTRQSGSEAMCQENTRHSGSVRSHVSRTPGTVGQAMLQKHQSGSEATWQEHHTGGQKPCVKVKNITLGGSKNIRHSGSETHAARTPGIVGQKPCVKNARHSGSETMWQKH